MTRFNVLPRSTRLSIQSYEISSESVSGAPLVLPFEEILKRPQQGREADIILAEEYLQGYMHWVWQFMD
jgi:hypothetical protein